MTDRDSTVQTKGQKLVGQAEDSPTLPSVEIRKARLECIHAEETVGVKTMLLAGAMSSLRRKDCESPQFPDAMLHRIDEALRADHSLMVAQKTRQHEMRQYINELLSPYDMSLCWKCDVPKGGTEPNTVCDDCESVLGDVEGPF